VAGLRVLLSATEIAARVDELAAEIVGMLPADLVMVGLLEGAWVFAADLARALERAGAFPKIGFMRLASYGLAKESTPAIQLLEYMPADLAGQPVLLVDHLAATGRSIAYAAAQLRERRIGNLWTCVLLDKPQRRGFEVALDFVGFTIDDLFVVGYGGDSDERYRHLPYIAVVD
jgi:hypoxanthine phosphoribosyltransferase